MWLFQKYAQAPDAQTPNMTLCEQHKSTYIYIYILYICTYILYIYSYTSICIHTKKIQYPMSNLEIYPYGIPPPLPTPAGAAADGIVPDGYICILDIGY